AQRRAPDRQSARRHPAVLVLPVRRLSDLHLLLDRHFARPARCGADRRRQRGPGVRAGGDAARDAGDRARRHAVQRAAVQSDQCSVLDDFALGAGARDARRHRAGDDRVPVRAALPRHRHDGGRHQGMSAQRMGMVIGVKPEKLAEYKRLHAEPWPEMNVALSAAHIRNYSIFLREPEHLLFGYWEYTGNDYAADMQVLGDLAVTKKWLALTDPCQAKLSSAAPGEWWCDMPEIYHLD